MNMHLQSFILLLGLLSGLTAVHAQSRSKYKDWAEIEANLIEKKLLHQPLVMRDGVALDTDIYLPATPSPYPAILIRSPYPLEWATRPSPLNVALLESGYAIVLQNERGRYWSGGDHEFLARAGEDGYDTVDWIAKQSWSNGKVGTYGCSSSAEHQLRLNVAAHPAHAAAIALGAGAGIGKIGPYAEQGNLYRGGALQLFFASWYREYVFYGQYGDARPRFPVDMSQQDRERIAEYFTLTPNYGNGARSDFDYERYFRHLPVIDLNQAVNGPRTDWERFSRRTPGDPAWKQINFANEGDTFGTPTLWGFSWYDIAVAPNVAMYNYAVEHTSTDRASDHQQMIVGTMPHCSFGKERKETIVGERKLGDARYDYTARFMEWFNYWLKGEKNGAVDAPKVQYYQMGANQWRSADRFPPQGTRYVDLFLDSRGNANTLYGDGVLSYRAPREMASDGFIYDPLRPVQTNGGGACCMGTVRASGAYDQSTLEMRSDVLVFTGPQLKEDLAVAGFVEAQLHVSSDAKDTDFTIKLIDVYPDGTAYNLDDTILRARYREGWDRQVFMERGKIYQLTFPPMITANTFKAGHRVRIEVSSSNFPRYERNLNTGGSNYDESRPIVARNRVHHSPRYLSRIRLPVKDSRN